MNANVGPARKALTPSQPKIAIGPHAVTVSIQRFLLQVWDALGVFITGIVCAIVYIATKLNAPPASEFAEDFILIAMRISLVAGLLAPFVFRPVPISRRDADWPGLLGQITLQVGLLISLLLAIGFLTRALIYVPREWAVGWSVTIFISAIGGRVVMRRMVKKAMPHSLLRQKIFVAGERAAVDALNLHLREAGDDDVEILGVFYEAEKSNPQHSFTAELIDYAKRHPVDKVLLAFGETGNGRLADVVNQLKALDVDIALCPYLISPADFQLRPGHLGGVPVFVLVTRPMGRKSVLLKNLEDKILAGLLLLIILPVMAMIAITIRLDSRGPVFFRQRRHGLNNAEFEILKFRTMASTATERGEKLRQTQRNDVRVTRVGRFLRRSSLDELPQLFNVLRGDMSLVGPRPHPTAMRTEDLLGPEIIAEYPHRHRVKPGMTGWAQVNGYRGATHTTDQFRRRVEYDIFYIENWSISFDIKILLLTPIKLIQNNDTAF